MIKSVMTDSFYPQISKVFKDPKKVQECVKIISRYVDRNTEKLSTTGPVKRTTFLDSDRTAIYDLIDVKPDNIKLVAKQVIEFSRGVNSSDPFNIAMVLIIRCFRLMKNDAARKSACLYLILSMYPSVHAKYFRFEPNENIMAFTINALSNKYKLKQTGTILGALMETVVVCDEHYKNSIIRGNDKDLADYISAVKTRLNSFMKNIFNEFISQHNSGRYLNYDKENNDPENFSKADSNSLVIERIATGVSLSLSVNGPDPKCIMLAAKMCKVAVNDVRATVTAICKDKKNKEEVRKVVTAIVYDFLFDGQNTESDIHDMKFTLHCANMYKKSNTLDTNIIQIKTILDSWLGKYSEAYNKTNRVATLNLFRKAIYMFFVFTIQSTKV
jgi:hypothetical protein